MRILQTIDLKKYYGTEPNISAEKLPLAALSAHCCEKTYGGQPRMTVRRILFCMQRKKRKSLYLWTARRI